MSEIKKCVLITALSIYGIACLFGLIGGILRSTTPDEECTYSSLMARTNLGYVVGCELAKPRFKGKRE